VEKIKSSKNPITCLRVNPHILESDDVVKSSPVSYRRSNQYGGTTCKFAATIARSMAHALKTSSEDSPYNAHFDWLKLSALSENRAQADDGKLAFKFLLRKFEKLKLTQIKMISVQYSSNNGKNYVTKKPS